MEFFLRSDAFKRIAARQWLSELYVTIGILVIVYFAFRDIGLFYYFIAAFAIIYGLIQQVIRLKRTKKEYLTYKITINNEQIYKTQFGSADVSIPREGISRIVEVPGSGLSIQAEQNIFIPYYLEGYESLKNKLIEWLPVETSPVSQNRANNESVLFRLANPNKKTLLFTFTVGGNKKKSEYPKLSRFSLGSCITGYAIYILSLVLDSIIDIPKVNEPYLMILPIILWSISFITGVIGLFGKSPKKSLSIITSIICGIPLAMIILGVLLISALEPNIK